MFKKDKTGKQDVFAENDEPTVDTKTVDTKTADAKSAHSHARNEEFEHGNKPQHPQQFQNLTNNSLVDPANQPEQASPEEQAKARADRERELADKALPVMIVQPPAEATNSAIEAEQEAQRRREEFEKNLGRKPVAIHSTQQKQAHGMRNIGKAGGRTVKPASGGESRADQK